MEKISFCANTINFIKVLEPLGNGGLFLLLHSFPDIVLLLRNCTDHIRKDKSDMKNSGYAEHPLLYVRLQ